MGALPRNRYGEAHDVRHSAVPEAVQPYLSRVEIRWVAYSAASLATGALALLLGALITPTGNAAESLSLVEMNDGRWLGAAVLFLIASITLTLGLPSIGTLLRGTPRLGLLALGVFAIGTIATAGYAMLLVFYRALVLTDSLNGPIADVTSDPGIAGFLVVFVAAFYLGELLLAIALYRAGTVARWIPAVLVAHVLWLAVGRFLPADLVDIGTLLLTAGLCGIAITANERDSQLLLR